MQTGGFSLIAPLLGLLRLSRIPNLIIITLTQYLTAVFLFHLGDHVMDVLTDHRFFLLSLSTVMIAAAGYMINDYYDTKIDYVNRPKKVIVGRILDRRLVLMLYNLFNSFGVLIGLYLSWQIAAVHIFSSFLLWLHSNQLKRMPLLGNLVIGVLAGFSLLIVNIYYLEFNLLVVTYSFFAFFINVAREILKDLEAIKGEEKFGSQALPIVLGMRKTKKFVYFLITISAIGLTAFLWRVNNHTLIAYFILLIPFFGYFTILLIKADTQQKFAFLSDLINFIMITGILSMLFF
ncbi:MAG: geranylgeranylglycerol-phosphate geranylgeranyltransferase [Bacteroidetes bacterium]|nr:geranylgeranylglycerol-phosphate geranylgeranyltransferase [Bacteroidota bacterium]MDA1119243.1 geranylgeranylglycerol-phosphate geranylgeranyltransferase [Bacteroidota bacterium]